MTTWDPQLYLRFGEERARPFHDLVGRIAVDSPRTVVDLGCGPGNMTSVLARRYPRAHVHGIDSSPAMIEAAQRHAGPQLTFDVGDVHTWQPERPVDLIVSNAVLQWVPDHTELFPQWLDVLSPGGALAFQVPATGPSGTNEVIRLVTQQARWRERLTGAVDWAGPRSTPTVKHPESYLDELARLGCAVDAWETTYYHVLQGPDPVLEWFRGTGLRPYFDALADDPEATAEFEQQMATALREAHPAQPYGTVLPFHRIFVIARRPR